MRALVRVVRALARVVVALVRVVLTLARVVLALVRVVLAFVDEALRAAGWGPRGFRLVLGAVWDARFMVRAPNVSILAHALNRATGVAIDDVGWIRGWRPHDLNGVGGG